MPNTYAIDMMSNISLNLLGSISNINGVNVRAQQTVHWKYNLTFPYVVWLAESLKKWDMQGDDVQVASICLVSSKYTPDTFTL